VKPAPFDYTRAAGVDEALALLAALGPDAKVLAGGQSLLPLLSMRLAAPAHLLDINRVPGLDGIRSEAAGVRVGALARHTAVERNAAARTVQPLLGEALRLVAHPTIRNRGTTVGSLVHADPAAEMPAVLCLLEGTVTVRSVRGSRTIPSAAFFCGPLESALAADELAVEAYFPACPPGTGSAVAEVSRRRGDYALVGVAATVGLDDDLRIISVRASYLSVAGTPVVLDLSAAVAGRGCDADLSAVGEAAWAALDPEADIHASADYRRHLGRVLTERVVRQAARRAAGLQAAA
jgi:carbon-monoxide dehydrogenase medium subunit